MKRTVSILLVTVFLALQLLTLSSFAEKPTAKLGGISPDVVYPGCTLELGIMVTGEDVVGLQFDKLISYDSEQLTMKSAPYSTVSSWEWGEGTDAYLLVSKDLVGIDAQNKAMVRFSFTLNDSVEIGDTIEVKVGNVKIVTNDKNVKPEYPTLSYSVTVAEKPKSTNCNLLRLDVAEGLLTPAFDAESTNSEYALTVPYTVESLSLSAATANEKASYEIEGNEGFVTGENTVKVIVTAESGAKRVYTITVTKQAPPSTETALSILEALEGTLSPEFDPAVTTYTLNVPSDVFALTLTIATLDPKATFVVSGNGEFKVGDNTVTVTVTAEDPSVTATYVLTVKRARPIETDAKLSRLELEGLAFDPIFDPASDLREYAVSVPYEIEKLPTIIAECASLYALKEIASPAKLEVGQNSVVVTVTAEDGVTVERYVITVTREARILESDSSLKELTPDSGSLSPAFDPAVTVYTMVMPIYHPAITFTVKANNFAASAKDVSVTLEKGLNTVKIPCTAENGSETVYTVHVFVPVREEQRGLILNGAPLPGEQLTTLLLGESKGGSYAWYVGDKQVEGATSANFTLSEEHVNKTVKAVYTDVDGTVLTSQTVTVLPKEAPPELPLEEKPEKTIGATEIVIVIVLIFLSLAMGVALGSYLVKRKYRAQ